MINLRLATSSSIDVKAGLSVVSLVLTELIGKMGETPADSDPLNSDIGKGVIKSPKKRSPFKKTTYSKRKCI